MKAHGNTARKLGPGALVLGAFTAATVLAGLVVFGSVACNRDSLQKGLAGAVPSTPDELLAELRNDKGRIDQTTDAMMQRIESFNATRKPGERQIQFGEIFNDNLNSEQKDILNQLVSEEKDVSYKALLESIIKDREAIRGLQEKVLHLEQTLPDRFVIAKKGDSHHDLAMSYLIDDAKLDKAKAKTLLASIDQTDELLPGNKVWFFYDQEHDTFRTYVTQGEAGQTPLVVRRAVKRQIISERDAALAQKAALEETRSKLESDISSLGTDIATLTDRRGQLEAEVAGLKQDNTTLETRVTGLDADLAFRQNSLFYHADSEQKLKDSGNLTTVFKRVKDVKGIRFSEALDLRKSTTITLTPQPYGLATIKGVRVLPAIYQEGRDFKIETADDGLSARVLILDPEMFRGKEVIVSVRG